MSYSLSPLLKPRFFVNSTNKPLFGGKLFTYYSGTTTLAVSYSDGEGTENTNPIILDVNGECNLYLDDDIAYRLILKDANNVVYFDRDNLYSIGSSAGAAANSASNANTYKNQARDYALSAELSATSANTYKNQTQAQAAISTENAEQTELDVISTNADAAATAADRVQTAADRVQTGLYLDEALAAVSVGVGSLAVQTLAALNAITTAPTNSIGYVTNDGTSANNGTYQWNGTVWTKSIYDPLTQAKTYTDAKITDRNHLADSFLYVGVLTSSNDFNALTVKDGTYVATSTPLHAPSGETGQAIIKVEKQGSFTVQTYQRLNDSRYLWKRTIQDGQTPEVWRDLSLINFSASRSNLADNFLYTGVLTSSNDLNTVQNDGAYVATSVPINAPVGAPAIALITVAKAGSMVRQIYTDVHDASISWSRNFQTVVNGGVPSIVSDGWMRGSLEIATISKLGGIKVGAGLLVAEDGTLSVTVPTQQNPFAGKKLVCFGDSITEFKNYPDQVRNILGLAEAYNVGFGGCQMTAHNDVAYKEMCMYRLADYIATGNYTGLIDAANDLYTRLSDDNRAIAARLAAIDFNTVDYITIFYGTNDWANKPGSLGLVTDKTSDGSTFLGSANYVVDRLQTAYPHLKIMFLSPIYRTRLVSGDNKNTDDYTNSSGEYMYQYVEGLQAVAKKNHVLCVDLYNESGINKYTAGLYLLPQPDGLHLSDTGATLIASKISAKMKANF